MSTVDRSSALPLWAQLEADLRHRLAAGEFEQRFPTEAVLTAEYEVSRQTVREALRRLSDAGLLTRQRGRGTSVKAAGALEQPLGGFYSLAGTIEKSGAIERSEVLLREFAHEPPAAAHLGLARTASLLHLVRLRYAGDEPLALDDAWLPQPLGRVLVERSFEHGSLYAFLAEFAGARATGASERITAQKPDKVIRSKLKMPQSAALLVIDRLTYSGERVIEWRKSLVRGDRFAFVADWKG